MDNHNITIPVTNHSTECTNHYIVEYRRDGLMDYTRLYPDPTIDTIVIGVSEHGLYNIRISRVCCDGNQSEFTEVNVNV